MLQELILARKVILHCGTQSVDWPIFQAMLYTMIRQAKRSGILHYSGLSSQSRREGIANQMLVRSVNSTFAFFFLQSASLYARQAQEFTMASLLSFTSSFEATDARDKLFALVGLLPEASPERLAFQPDYTANARQLFIRVAKYFLQTTRKLDVMTARPQMPYYYRLRSKPESYATPPSWAADWQQPQVWMYNSIWISRFSEFKTLSMFMHDEEKEDDTGHDSHDSHDCGHDLHAAAPEEPIHTGEIPGPAAQLQHKAN